MILKIYLSSIKCITYRIHILEEFDQASLEVGNTESRKREKNVDFLCPDHLIFHSLYKVSLYCNIVEFCWTSPRRIEFNWIFEIKLTWVGKGGGVDSAAGVLFARCCEFPVYVSKTIILQRRKLWFVVLKTRAKLQVSVLGVSNCFEEIFCKLQHQIVLGWRKEKC